MYFLHDEFHWFLRALADLEIREWISTTKDIKFLPKTGCCRKNHVIKMKIHDEWNSIEIPEKIRQQLILDLVPKALYFDASVQKYGDVATRERSFKDWKIDFIPTSDLSRAGFYYTGIGDVVRCFACNGLIYSWENGDDPLTEHKKHFPLCSFVKKIQSYDDAPKETRLIDFGCDVIDKMMNNAIY
ncbi:baculoviral IAP repeat-containing protein 3-like isoform X2 [Leptotrombidium deliense]|uniref:Baculoviral IAP repeat-containing protein 3-like isoform X2 n=1 Tax=Leptotrombidium deliense TaxID=299467 RepID=A0A443S461_9ACAR|nr:baculoviral IAP repeat-containing protein 3-like isoform X2 [Leptotrombidium deliense]